MNDQLKAGSLEPAPRSAVAITETILKSVDWASPTMGYCECPGKRLHSTNDGKRECVVYLDRVPTLHCMHAGCASEVEKMNRQLRVAILNPEGDADFALPKLTAEDKARMAERDRNERIRVRAAKSLPQLLKEHHWGYDEIMHDSPTDVRGDCSDHWKMLLGKFAPDDVVWIGGVRDSGGPECAANFKPVSEWLTYGRAPGQFTCPVSFKNNSNARSNANILARRFLVVESDVLNKDEVGGVFRWLMKCGLRLVAVVDTAGRSLHGWFDFVTLEPSLDELKLVLPAFQCDPKLFTASQPVRLPSAMRGEKVQKLVYLSKEVACE